MKKFILTGELGEKFGRIHEFNVKTVAEGIRALRANFKEFESFIIGSDKRNVGYRVYVNKEDVMDEEELLHPLGKRGDIIISPAIYGSSGTAKIIVGVALIAVGVVLAVSGYGTAAAPYFIGIGVSLTLGGIVQLLSPLPKLGVPKERNLDDQPSYYFTGAVNTSAQGEPVPILYGEMIVGSAVISAGIVVEELT